MHSLTRGVALSLRAVKSRVPRESNLVGAHGHAPFLNSRFHGNDGRLLRSARNDMSSMDALRRVSEWSLWMAQIC